MTPVQPTARPPVRRIENDDDSESQKTKEIFGLDGLQERDASCGAIQPEGDSVKIIYPLEKCFEDQTARFELHDQVEGHKKDKQNGCQQAEVSAVESVSKHIRNGDGVR